MELQRGVCHLCLENSRVLTASNAEEFTKHLPQILYENFLPKSETIKDSLKICSVCCFKVQTASEIKKAIQNAEEINKSSGERCCHFCREDSCLITIGGDWKYFNDRAEGFVKPRDFPIFICPKCFFYFDTIFSVKTKLLFKFPQLIKKSNPRENNSAKRNSSTKPVVNSKRRKTGSSCFTYLQPLSLSRYQVDDKLKQYDKLYRKIPYINMKDVKIGEEREAAKVRPIIKIKLKKPKEKSSYVRLVKSEEVVRRRRRSKEDYADQTQESSEAIDTTPKTTGSIKLVPKRRVSDFVIVGQEENEEKSEPPPAENNSEDINNVVDKYIADSTFNDKDKLELLEEIEDNAVEKNGIEESPHKKEETNEVEKLQNDDTGNEENVQATMEEKKDPDVFVQNDNQKNVESENSSTSSSSESSKKSPSKSDSSSDESDSDSSEKLKDVSNNDSLNGSERKKKRVTFSDEIN